MLPVATSLFYSSVLRTLFTDAQHTCELSWCQIATITQWWVFDCCHLECSLHFLQGLVRRFCGDRELWGWAVDSVAELDALMSLASHALNAGG
jgi:hypothetical protein